MNTKHVVRSSGVVSRTSLRRTLTAKHPLVGRRYLHLGAVDSRLHVTCSVAFGVGGGNFVRRLTIGGAYADCNSPATPVCAPANAAAGGRRRVSPRAAASGEQTLFPVMGVPSDPVLSAAISSAESWQQLRDLYTVSARRIDPGQLLGLTQRLAHVTGAVVWPAGAPLPEPAPLGGAPGAPELTEQEAEEVVSLAQNLCRATQVCLAEMYSLQQVSGLLQALVCLGVAPPQGWLRSAELVALRTQREGQQQEGAPRATSELLNELLVVAGAFQRLGHVPERSFVALMGEVRPLEEVQAGSKSDSPLLLVLSAPQLITLARAVLLWGLQPPAEWPELFLQASYTRISRANQLLATSRAVARSGLGGDEEVEAAEAEMSLGLGGLAALLWAAVTLEARPADPGGQWMREFTEAALRQLRGVVEAPQVVVAAEAAGGDTAAADSGPMPEVTGATMQDLASLLSALQQMMYNPGATWVNTCLQAAAALQLRTDPLAAAEVAASTGSPMPGDSLASVLFLAAQYDHIQDEATRGSVVNMAQAAQVMMALQVESSAAAVASSGTRRPPSLPLFSSRGLTQVLMALVRMGGQPSDEWIARWSAVAAPLAGGPAGDCFDVDQMVAVLATAAEAEMVLPEDLQKAMVGGLLLPSRGDTLTPSGSAGAGAPGGIVLGTSLSPGASALGGSGSGRPTSSSSAVRSLSQFRQLLGILDLQSSPLDPDLLEPFTALVEDFRLRLGSRELLDVLLLLGRFRDALLNDNSRPDLEPTPKAPSPSRQQTTPIVIRPAPTDTSGSIARLLPSFPFPTSTAAAAAPGGATAAGAKGGRGADVPSASLPALLDSSWMRGLLDDVKVRGGVRGPTDLMQLAQALSSLSAPPSLMSYIEVFAVALTAEDGRPRVTTPRSPHAPTADTGAPVLATGGSPAPAAASKPSVARIRLRLQKEAAERRGATRALGSDTDRGESGLVAEEVAAEAAEAEVEEQQWTLAWPAMLGAFAAAGHVPERRWWDRFSAVTLPALELYEGPRLATTAMAALGLSSRAALVALEEGGEGGEVDEQALAARLLPSLEWYRQVLSHVAEMIRSCPVSIDEIRDQAVEILSEQRRLRPDGASPSDQEGAEGGEAATPVGSTKDGDDSVGDSLEFSMEEFSEMVGELSSQLPMILEPLAQPGVALPPELVDVLKVVAEEAADGAAAAVAAAAAVVAGSALDVRGRNRPFALPSAGGGGGGVDEEMTGFTGGQVDLDSIVYAQQVVTLVMQILIASEQYPPDSWWTRVLDLMMVSRPGWGPVSETGELQEQQHLLLSPDQLTSLAYLAGKAEVVLKPQQVRLLLQQSTRLVAAGELASGELAATLAGLSGLQGVDVAEEGPEEVAELLEALGAQSGRLSAAGVSEAATALLQFGLGLQPDLAVKFRGAVLRVLTDLTPPQMLTVLTVGGSLGLEPPSRELLVGLSMQMGRLAESSDSLAVAATTEVAYQVLKWFPEVAASESETYISRLKEGLKPLLVRLDEVAPASASKLSLLLATVGLVPGEVERQDGKSAKGSDADVKAQWKQRSEALAPLVEATGEGMSDYDLEQLSNAIMGLSLMGMQLPGSWLEQFIEASRRQLSEADGRSLAYLLSGLADQEAVLDGAFAAAFWEVVRERAEGSDQDLDLLIVRMLVEAAGQLGMRPERDLMQSMLDCALLRYRESPNPDGLLELVQVMADSGFAPSPRWASEVKSVLSGAVFALPTEQRGLVMKYLQEATRQSWK